MRNLLEPQEDTINLNELHTLFINVLDYFNKAYIKMSSDMPYTYQNENNINDKIYEYLVNTLEEEGITSICPIPQNFDPRQRPSHGRASQVDFLIRWSLDVRKDKYQFFIECKLLNCNGKNQAYCDNGINRFKTNFYAKHLPFAAMIGYVERGEVPTIIDDLNRIIEPNSIRKIHQLWRSVHQRDNGNCDIRIYHLFFDFRDCQENPHSIRACPNNNGLLKSPLP